MSNEHRRDHGKLFEYAEKPKPSHPDFHGDAVIDGTAYTIKGWHREEQLTIQLDPERVEKNGLPPLIFRGSLDPAPPKPAPAKTKGKKGKAEPEVDDGAPPVPAWSGVIVADELAYLLRAFEKQGKSGPYFTLTFEKTEKPTDDVEWVDAEPT